MKKAFYQFEKLFKKEKVLAAPHKQQFEMYIDNIKAEIEYHNLGDDTYPHLKYITLQITTILDEFKGYHTTLSIIEEVFERKSNYKVQILN